MEFENFRSSKTRRRENDGDPKGLNGSYISTIPSKNSMYISKDFPSSKNNFSIPPISTVSNGNQNSNVENYVVGNSYEIAGIGMPIPKKIKRTKNDYISLEDMKAKMRSFVYSKQSNKREGYSKSAKMFKNSRSNGNIVLEPLEKYSRSSNKKRKRKKRDQSNQLKLLKKKTLPSRKKHISTANDGSKIINLGEVTEIHDEFFNEIIGIEERMKRNPRCRDQRNRGKVFIEGTEDNIGDGLKSLKSIEHIITFHVEEKGPLRKTNDQTDTTKNIFLEEHFFQFDQAPLKLRYDPNILKRNKGLSSVMTNKTLKDYKIMVGACNRAGKHRSEAICHYKAACMYEEEGKSMKAIMHFRKYLWISNSLKDNNGLCLAYNRLGVIYQLLGGRKNLQKGLEFHLKHYKISDLQNRVVAHINMGLIFESTGVKKDMKNAIEHFKLASKFAKEIGDKHGQSIALLNLGLLKKKAGDSKVARSCIQKHLKISKKIKNESSKSEAYQKLGVIALNKGKDENAVKMFKRARDIAKANNDQMKSNQLKCFLGIIRGNKEYENFFEKMKEKVEKV